MEFSDNYAQPSDLSADRNSEELRAYSYDLDERCLNFGLSAIDLTRR